MAPSPPITELYAWVAVNPESEGILGVIIGGSYTPLVASSFTLIQRFRDAAVTAGKAANCTVKLKQFSNCATIQTIDPS